MTTSFAAQLSRIAATSTHELDVRARRNLHSESLLFPRDVAAKQDFDSLYTICHEGFRELCLLDVNFTDFERNLFSAQARAQDRDLMNKSENEALNGVIERFCRLLGSRILLTPGVRALEWLIRRFRAHVHNAAAVLLAALPYHDTPVWRNVLSIVPANLLVGEWKWIAPYKSDSLNVPRHTVVFAATNNDGFWTKLNGNVIRTAREGCNHSTLYKFWAAVAFEAVAGKLAAARSGRREIQKQRTEDALLKILPVLSDGFEIKNCPELTTALLTLTIVVAAKAELEDYVLDSLLHTIATSVQSTDVDPQSAVMSIALIVSRKSDNTAPRAVVDFVSAVPQLQSVLWSLPQNYPYDTFAQALISGALSTFKKKNIGSRVDLIEVVLQHLADSSDLLRLRSSLSAIVAKIASLSKADQYQSTIHSGLVNVLQRLSESDKSQTAIAEALKDMDEMRGQLEIMIGATILAIQSAPPKQDAMEIDNEPVRERSVEQLFSVVPARTVEVSSFLAEYDEHLFEVLAHCFSACCRDETLLDRFAALPIWSSGLVQHMLWYTFLLRVSGMPSGNLQRGIALTLLGKSIRDSDACDVQAVIPYALVALSDQSPMVRRAASDLVVAASTTMTSKAEGKRFGSEGLYAKSTMEAMDWIPSAHATSVIQQVLLPVLEECVLDASRIQETITLALNGPAQPPPEGFAVKLVELKKSSRNSFFQLLITHANVTPILATKVQIINLLENVQKIGSVTKSAALSSNLDSWWSLSLHDAQEAAKIAGLSVGQVDAVMMQLVSATNTDTISNILTALGDRTGDFRSGLISAFFNRLKTIWREFKHDLQLAVALRLFDLSFAEAQTVSSGAQDVLQSVKLNTQILGGLVEQSTANIAQLQAEAQQPRKKRRTSHGQDSFASDLARTLDNLSARTTLALELVDDSKPEARPELLSVLFDLLATLKRLHSHQQLDSPYILNLCLSNILAITNAQRAIARPTIDMSSIRADLVTDWIRTSNNPQVQNTSLLLSASLASLAPDRMLHNVMPIFTFMGQNMFSKEDDHSVYVIGQAIDQIIPALVDSLKQQNKDVVRSTSALLSSFAAAFDHIPPHRRVAVYQQLLSRMGIDDFAFVLLSMLSLRKENNTSFRTFVDDVLAEFSPHAQLVTYRKVIELIEDLTLAQPQIAKELLRLDQADVRGVRTSVQLLWSLAMQILKSKSLQATTNKLHRLPSSVSEPLKAELSACLQQILVFIKNQRQVNGDVEIAKQCLDALLALPSLLDLFRLLPNILAEMGTSADLKPQTLRVLASQLEGRPPKDSKTRAAAMSLLSELIAMLAQDADIPMKQAIVVCIDRISEAYGRKNIEEVVIAAAAVAGETCLGSQNRRLRIMSLLSLASLLEVLKEACVPIVPDLTASVVTILDDGVAGADAELHDAAFALVTAVVSHVPFLVSDDVLTRLMTLSSKSATSLNSVSSTESRVEALSTIARKIELSTLLASMQAENLDGSPSDNMRAADEKIIMLNTAIETATKATVINNADSMSRLLLANLDRRRRSHTPDETAEVVHLTKFEERVSRVAIQFIYKLNDTTFRPLFETWIEWATDAHDLPDQERTEQSRLLRQTSLFHLLEHFFDTLEAIVTSYASYIIQPAVKILNDFLATLSTSKKSVVTRSLVDHHTSLLTVLKTIFTHDADAFFAAPSHFSAIGPALISQLQIASTKSLRSMVPAHIMPAIVALAQSTVDHPSHHQTLAHHLVQLRRSSSPAVRLTSVQTLAALSSDSEIGDDFVANTIGVGSASHGGVDGEGSISRSAAGTSGSIAGELMIYVNEMLEDDDENVEKEVRMWVQSVRERVGEDVFEM